ncbi:cytochrome P450 [Streptosporangium lutulentum]|uniref:Cytochrome P450 n=1 Tax=Streptosporangium lutulentum TaxID=1461250 RepID=A0ABT9QN68_9ACTN|nr:cytochrome P450 [Streptosporangium lutulentum]MDP9848189.1 cytochrome P450 [Streptosporangium lutulentum]
MTNDPDLVSVPPPGCPAHTDHASPVPLYGPRYAADPGLVFDRLRRSGPVAPVELAPGVHAKLVTGYYAALGVLRSPQMFSKDPRRWRALAEGEVPPDSPVIPMMGYRPNALFADGTAHTRLRQAITDSLDRVDPHALRGYAERSADTLIDRFAPRGEAELLAGYAGVLPLLIFNRLFGLDDSDSDRLVAALAKMFEGGAGAEEGDALFGRYVQDLVALKRARPGQDMTSWLMSHPSQLTDEEMLHQCTLLIAAGTEPVQNLIGNALRLLLADDRFAGSLSGGSMSIDAALDEVLWLDPPMANYAVHYPLRDVDLGGVRLKEGEPVVVSLAAANTDPALTHAMQRSGNRAHLAFSAGPHTCPARDAARLIAAVAIERLMDRVPDVELAVPVNELQWRPGPFHRALTTLPVRFTPIQIDETSGDSSWNLAPSAWIRPAATSTPRPPDSATPARRRRWSFLAEWWRGR